MKNSYHDFAEPKVIPCDCLICPTNSPKPRYISFTIMHDKEKLQILCLAFLLEKLLKRLIDYKDSCRLIFFPSINRLRNFTLRLQWLNGGRSGFVKRNFVFCVICWLKIVPQLWPPWRCFWVDSCFAHINSYTNESLRGSGLILLLSLSGSGWTSQLSEGFSLI